MPTFTIISCATAVLAVGATPVLVDCDPRTWCMDVDQVRGRLSGRTRAIMPVHIYGHPVDMDPLLELADARGLAVLEDAAEAHGAEYLTGRPSTSDVEAVRQLRRPELLQLLREQDRDHGRRRDGAHR